jgi:hypothetical protein
MYAEASGQVIPWTISRGASDIDQPWPSEAGKPKATAKEAIEFGLEATDDAEYACVTAAIPVLAYLQSLGRGATPSSQ